jgi:multiple sugar transport system permease protein
MNVKWRETVSGYLFILPALLFFLVFIAEPIVASLILSFADYNIIRPFTFTGLDNLIRLFHDDKLLTVYSNTLKLVGLLVPLHLIIGLLLAAGVSGIASNKLKFLYRTAFYFPVLVTTSAVAIAWVYIFNVDFGILNYGLGLFGIDPVNWIQSKFWVYPALAIFNVWKHVGIAFLYYLIGLQNIPLTLYEAARIDGASKVQSFFRITLPMLTPMIFFTLVIALLHAMQIFDEPYLITNGGPLDATRTIGMYIYDVAFQSQEMGYASVVALSLFAIILVITLVQFKVSKSWVNYDQE